MIGILGAGAFGTALGIALARDGIPVTLWARDADHAADMIRARCNDRRLPERPFPDRLGVTDDLQALGDADILLLSVPLGALHPLCAGLGPALSGTPLVACCKGIAPGEGLGPAGVIADAILDARTAILTGPSFAADIAQGLPTALTLACADRAAGRALQDRLSTSALRLYLTTDVAGAELGGAFKNVVAIACGAAMGAGLGESARAALMTRGFAEMTRLAATRGARPETLAGLSGFGDLALTCTSDQSRNYRLGLSIGRGGGLQDGVTVEGAGTARAIAGWARSQGVDLPITAAVAALLDRRQSVAQVMETLLSRPLKEE